MESVLNAETLGNNACATGGKLVSSYQVDLLIKSPVEKLVLLLDPDGYLQAIKLALELSFYKRVKVCLLPNNMDVNSLGKRATMKTVYKTPYLPYNQLLKLKLNYERSVPTY